MLTLKKHHHRLNRRSLRTMDPGQPLTPPVPAPGFALSFNGANQYLYIQETTYGNVDWSVEAWVRTTAAGSDSEGWIVGNTEGSDLRIFTGKAMFQVAADTINNVFSSGTINDGTWHHIVGVRAASVLRMYVDGQLNNWMNFTGAPEMGFREIARRGSDTGYFNGQLDEVRCYNRALTDADVAAHWNGGAGQTGQAGEAGLVAGWHMDEGTGNTAEDYSGHGRTALLVNGPTWVEGKVG